MMLAIIKRSKREVTITKTVIRVYSILLAAFIVFFSGSVVAFQIILL